MTQLMIEKNELGPWEEFVWPVKTHPSHVSTGDPLAPQLVFAFDRLWAFWIRDTGERQLMYLSIDKENNVDGPWDANLPETTVFSSMPALYGQHNFFMLVDYHENKKNLCFTLAKPASQEHKLIFTPYNIFADFKEDIGTTTRATPITAFDGKPLIAYVDLDEKIRLIARHEGQQDLPGPITTKLTRDTVGLVTYQGYAHLAYKRNGNTSISFARADDSVTAEPPWEAPPESAKNVSGGVSLAVYAGALYCSFRSSDDGYARYFRYDGAGFGPTERFTQKTKPASVPSLAAAWSRLYCAYSAE